ncbi:hypothetical protein [Methylocystis parvus]|uniref:hypothetical protein n=1 Tax=Methylocystis parvus TaxID=134 RepID=UPI003C719E4E
MDLRLHMGSISLIRLAVAALAFGPLVTQAASRPLAPAARTPKKTANPLLPGKAIAPIEAPEKTPATGWSGFYFGVNAGAARSETNR